MSICLQTRLHSYENSFYVSNRIEHHLTNSSKISYTSWKWALLNWISVLQILEEISCSITFFHCLMNTFIQDIEAWGAFIHFSISCTVSWMICWIKSFESSNSFWTCSKWSWCEGASLIRSKTGKLKYVRKFFESNHLCSQTICPNFIEPSTESQTPSHVWIATSVVFRCNLFKIGKPSGLSLIYVCQLVTCSKAANAFLCDHGDPQ